jgi:hypothetical protein
VFVHDAIDYMVTESDLRAAIETAFVHCRPGGVAVFVPDDTIESFGPVTDHGGHDGRDGEAVRYLSWSWRLDTSARVAFTDYAFVLREADGTTHSVHERHEHGLFTHEHWLRELGAVGFEVEAVDEDRAPRTFFVGHRPV